MKVKELVSKCDMNYGIEFKSKEQGYLFKRSVGEIKFAVDSRTLTSRRFETIDHFQEHFLLVGIAEQEILDFRIRGESGYIFPIIEIYI